MENWIVRLATSGDRGATMIEYALMVSLIAVVSVSAVAMVGHHTEDTFDNMTVALGGEAPDGEADAPGDDHQGADQPGDPDDDPDDPGPDTDESDDGADDPGPDTDEGDATGDTTDQGSNVEILDNSAELTSWKGNEGTWSALVTFANDWDHDQELTVEVTQIDGEKGAQPTTTLTVKVASGAKSILALEDNQLLRKGKDFNGTVAVEIRVVSVTTKDAKGQPVTYTLDHGPSTTVEHPTP